MPLQPNYFSTLTDQLTRRAARATLSHFGLASHPLRDHLRTLLEQPPGNKDSFLAQPVFEGFFGWEEARPTMKQLSGNLLMPALVNALDDQPKEQPAIKSNWHPYCHQLAAWEALANPEPRSVVVSSGTGSGKTECFLVPILNDLIRQREERGRLTGVQAIFLYPLNALISSQRNRLSAWCKPFAGDVRFCLYNGETKENRSISEQNETPEEVLSRTKLREEPPPILVTNASMLEYMLVRSIDSPIISQSQGMLRYIVLDEAHSYVGSQAAEIALLLRRVIHAFGVRREDVRFIATSATIGDQKEGGISPLKQFLADLAGTTIDRVTLVEGTRKLPPLLPKYEGRNSALPPLDVLEVQDDKTRFETLASNAVSRKVRNLLSKQPLLLNNLSDALWGENASSSERWRDTLRWLDCAQSSRLENDSFLPLRGHFFQRGQGGIWVCVNQACPDRKNTDLDHPDWPFGKLFFSRRERCDCCKSPVYEMAVCFGCGAEYLLTREENVDGKNLLLPRETETDDEFALEIEPDTDDENEIEHIVPSKERPRLLGGYISKEQYPVSLDVQTGEILEHTGDPQLGLTLPHDADEAFVCPCCRERERIPLQNFRPMRIGAPFYLSVAIPTLLEQSPPTSKGPFGGRRLITFTDSRQGTARFAAKAQIDAERNHVRSIIYHMVRVKRGGNEEETRALEAQIGELQAVIETVPALMPTLEDLKKRFAAANGAGLSRISWKNAIQELNDDSDVRDWMRQQWSDLAYGHIGDDELNEFLLYREFVYRPKRYNSLETLGLVGLDYPNVENLQETNLPSIWTAKGKKLEDWKQFIKIILDFFIRASSATNINRNQLRWLGQPGRQSYIIPPGEEKQSASQRYWPSIHRSQRSRIIRLAALYLNLELDNPQLENVMLEAWRSTQGLLKRTADGFLLPLEDQCDLVEIRKAWVCPYTHRVVDKTLGGYSPYLPAEGGMPTKAVPIEMPTLPWPMLRDEEGHKVLPAEVQTWLEEDPTVRNARDMAVWPELSDRIVSLVPYFRVVEHSAQIKSSILRKREEDFKSGKINVMSCSTTMEMGVDIGDINTVAMNNAPPNPANFLQRAGRAGRRDESAISSFTFCKSLPHGEAIFNNPMWPFVTPLHVPQVSLQSERIVRRHVNALILAFFMKSRNNEALRLTCQEFYEPPMENAKSLAEDYCDWCREMELSDQPRLASGIEMLINGTPLGQGHASHLLEASAGAMEDIHQRWSTDIGQLEAQRQDVAAPAHSADKTPGETAIDKQLARMRGEYLLGELASQGFLPGYGFPTQVVPFVNDVWQELKRERRRQREVPLQNGVGREEHLGRFRSYPSRQLPLAIRDYAPGNEVVIDGRVYRSQGITLNWHVPAGRHGARELQMLANSWHCKSCGSSGVSRVRVEHCLNPRCNDTALEVVRFVQPSGFSVDIGYSPHNDITAPGYIPVEEPRITVHGEDWIVLPKAGAGRFRYDPDGHIFHYSRGLYGEGFALCLHCGRADSEEPGGIELPRSLQNHHRLRGGKDSNPERSICSGNDGSDWAIQRRIWLGVESRTDVFELQLTDPQTGQGLTDHQAAYSIAVALREAAAQYLGIETRELGCATAKALQDNGKACYSLFVYDSANGGAGYVSSIPSNLKGLLKKTRRILSCEHRQCDEACQSCLLTYDTQHQISQLNRHAGLRVLTDELIESVSLREDDQLFGAQSRLEVEPLHKALQRYLQHKQAVTLRIYLGNDPSEWDLEEMPILNTLKGIALRGAHVSLVVTPTQQDKLPSDVANLMASLNEAADIAIFENDQGVGSDQKLLEVECHSGVRIWGSGDASAHTANNGWGIGISRPVVYYDAPGQLGELSGINITAKQLRKTPPGLVEIEIGNECDGPVSEFGKRFWKPVLQKTPGLLEQLKQAEPLQEITYSDRYLRSPLMLKLLHKMLSELKTVPALIDSETQLSLNTSRLDHRMTMEPSMLHHNWIDGQVRQEIMLKTLRAIVSTVRLRDTDYAATLPHGRRLEMVWNSGTIFTLDLDQGLGYWKTAKPRPFAFSANSSLQTANLEAIDTDVMRGSPLHVTRVYAHLKPASITSIRGVG